MAKTTTLPTETFTTAQVAELVKSHVETMGGAAEASYVWRCSPQMVHMVSKGQRRPTDAMLKAIGMEPMPTEILYRKVKK